MIVSMIHYTLVILPCCLVTFTKPTRLLNQPMYLCQCTAQPTSVTAFRSLTLGHNQGAISIVRLTYFTSSGQINQQGCCLFDQLKL